MPRQADPQVSRRSFGLRGPPPTKARRFRICSGLASYPPPVSVRVVRKRTTDRLRDRMLDLAAPTAADQCVDLGAGAGAGLLTLALAPVAARVVAVERCAARVDDLRSRLAGRPGVVETELVDMKDLRLPPAS